MKTAIVYYSKHHGNTKKLLDALAQENDLTLLDVTDHPVVDLSEYDRIGYASGIYYSKFPKLLLQFAEDRMPQDKQTFFYLYLRFEKERLYRCDCGGCSKA